MAVAEHRDGLLAQRLTNEVRDHCAGGERRRGGGGGGAENGGSVSWAFIPPMLAGRETAGARAGRQHQLTVARAGALLGSISLRSLSSALTS